MKTSKKLAPTMPTLVHVARLAGVGLGTASRALSGQGYVSEETAARIHSAAEQLGYQRNELARSLKVRRSGSIGLVVPDIGGPFMATCVRSLQRALRAADYNSIIAFTDGNEEVESEEIDYLIRHQIDGLIVVPAGPLASHFQAPQLRNIPVVSFDQPIHGKEYDSILVRNRQGAFTAVEHLIHHGHKRVACLGVNQQLYSIQKRMEGYRDAMKAAHLQPLLAIADPENDGIGKQLDSWLKLSAPPTAIFSLNELTTLQLVEAFSHRGIRIPDQMAFIGFDDIQLGPYLNPPLSVVLQPATEIGESTASRLLERLANKEITTPKRILLDTQLILRQSCGCSEKGMS